MEFLKKGNTYNIEDVIPQDSFGLQLMPTVKADFVINGDDTVTVTKLPSWYIGLSNFHEKGI